MAKNKKKQTQKKKSSKQVRKVSNFEEPLFLLVKKGECKYCDHFISSNTFSCSDDDPLEFDDLEDNDHSIQFDALERSGNNPFAKNSNLEDEELCKIETLEAEIRKIKVENKNLQKLLQILDEKECVYKEEIIKLKTQLNEARKIEEGKRKQYQILEAEMATLRINSKEKAIQLMTNQKPLNTSLHTKKKTNSTKSFKRPTTKDDSSSKNNK